MLPIVIVHCGQVVLCKDPYVGQNMVLRFTVGGLLGKSYQVRLLSDSAIIAQCDSTMALLS